MVAISLPHGSKTPWGCGLLRAFARPGVRLEPVTIGRSQKQVSLQRPRRRRIFRRTDPATSWGLRAFAAVVVYWIAPRKRGQSAYRRSEEQTTELQSLIRLSYAVFCLKHKTDLPTEL